MTSEWVEWHQVYEQDGPLANRLVEVQSAIRKVLDGCEPGPIRVVSFCAGDGRDLIGAVAEHPRAADVSALLVELDPDLVKPGRERAKGSPAHVVFCEADASLTDVYAESVPADLVLVCGVFGNISQDDIRNTIDHLPEFCGPGASVIWTRGRFASDLTPAIRGWFEESGFAEQSFVPIPSSSMSVGVHKLIRAPQPLSQGLKLFTFLNKDERPSQSGAH